jgi:hypothetical protein
MEGFAMAQKVVTTLVDDLDGTEIEEGKGETIKFSIESVSYEIDLSDSNAKKFRDAISPFVDKARRAGRTAGAARAGSRRNSPEELAAARDWLRSNGHEVNDRGRIPASLMEVYRSSK